MICRADTKQRSAQLSLASTSVGAADNITGVAGVAETHALPGLMCGVGRVKLGAGATLNS